jgi:DNA-binding CsgD family transcriptional regulator
MHHETRRHVMRLSAEQGARVRAEIASPPQSFGYLGATWNGKLLSRHLGTNLGIELGVRQCRRLLRVYGVAPAPRRRNPRPCAAAEPVCAPENEPLRNSGMLVRSPVAGARRKDLVLRKIRRLASSGLPLYPFVLTLFDLIAEAIPAGDLPRGILTDPTTNLSWVFANLDQAKWVPVLANLVVGYDAAAWPGLRPRSQLDPTRPVMTLEEFTAPEYRRSALYNEFFHPLRLEQGVLIQLADHGELVGYYPLYRSSAMKPFDREDLRFLAAAAPHIAHGLRTARLVEVKPASPNEPGLQVGTPGVVVMDHCGRILSLDQRARSLFFQIGLCDGLRASAFAERELRPLLNYVARTLRAIFDDQERPFAEFAPPAARILSHRAGIELRLRGHVTTGERDHQQFVVLVEQLEPEAFYRLRLMYRYGLTPREAEMLVLLRHGPSVAQIATALGISTPTAKTYVSHLIEKLGVANLNALRARLAMVE